MQVAEHVQARRPTLPAASSSAAIDRSAQAREPDIASGRGVLVRQVERIDVYLDVLRA
jgi:hypothetical protein